MLSVHSLPNQSSSEETLLNSSVPPTLRKNTFVTNTRNFLRPNSSQRSSSRSWKSNSSFSMIQCRTCSSRKIRRTKCRRRSCSLRSRCRTLNSRGTSSSRTMRRPSRSRTSLTRKLSTRVRGSRISSRRRRQSLRSRRRRSGS